MVYDSGRPASFLFWQSFLPHSCTQLCQKSKKGLPSYRTNLLFILTRGGQGVFITIALMVGLFMMLVMMDPTVHQVWKNGVPKVAGLGFKKTVYGSMFDVSC